MSGWNNNVLSNWFAVARSERLMDKPIAVTVLDRHIALVRFKTGNIAAFEDRCPHRQMPLSQGRLTSKGLTCSYHGWTFDSDGRCALVPGMSANECRPDVGIRTYEAKEIDGLIWVRLATNGMKAPPTMVDECHSEARRFLWQSVWHANIVDAIENFLDPLHTHLVHPGLVRNDLKRRRVEAVLSVTEDGFCVDYQGPKDQTGILYRLFESSRISEKAYFAGAGSAQIEYCYENGSEIRITLHFTPESVNRTHVFASLHVKKRFAPKWAVRLFVWPFLKKVARQDAHILKMQSENISRFPNARNASSKLDFIRPYLEEIWRENEQIDFPVEVNRIELYL